MAKHSHLTQMQECQKFLSVVDERFDAYKKNNVGLMLFRDAMAGLIVALVAIPLGIGFSIASGMRPENGIIAGAIAGIIGGFLGGSKFQVYGPTAAFIPIISGIIHRFDVPFLILASIIAGIIVVLMGIFRLGRFFNFVPHSIIVGFTIGIAATITISQIPNILGETGSIGFHVFEKLQHFPDMLKNAHGHALLLGMLTIFLITNLSKISIYVPAALIAMLVCTFVANNIWHEHLIPLVYTQYGDIGQNLFAITPPSLGSFTLTDLIVPVLSITFIAALESLLSARMADRLGNNHTPFDPDKELFGQGVVNCVVPILNGFPCTGALARTATNIKVGAVSPMSSILKGTSVIVLMVFCASYLSSVPMAFVGGLLLFVASNMVKIHEVKIVLKEGKFHTSLMVYTAVATIVTDLAIAVVSATALYHSLKYLLGKFAPGLAIASYEHALGASSVAKSQLPAKQCPNCGYQLAE